MFQDEYKHTFSQVRPAKEFDPEEIYMNATPKHTPIRRIVTIAVAAALILVLSITAYATDLFGLMDFIMPEDYQSSSLPDDAVNGASTRAHISISGFTDSPEAKASAEWQQYYKAYDRNSIEWDKDDLPQVASYYGAYNYEMYDKLKEIAAKYELQLLGDVTIGRRAGHNLNGTEGSYYQYDNGSFKEECVFIHDNKTYSYSLIRNVKGTLSAGSLEIWDAESWETWSYTAPQGYEVAIGLSNELFAADGTSIGNRGLIMTDLGDCFVTLFMISWDEPITPEAMQAAAEALDYNRLATIES